MSVGLSRAPSPRCPGARPTHRDRSDTRLAQRTGAARETVRRALAQLEGAGVLDVRHGKGGRVRTLPANLT
ncbi:helix-turn-helix domain-containing protein [Kitasatospora sp. NPDC005751]|uniref:helix-turn-helix domain-containing protein n=1 Tax=Kitasatospora sp. NPDC005751 TaxID=3157064 RepID=UPI00340B3599